MKFKWLHFSTAGGYSDMVGHAGSRICTVHTDLTLTWSKVKVTDLLKFQKLHFSTSTSSAILAWRSQLMGDYDSMGPSVQLFGARFLNSPPVGRHVISKFATCWCHQNPLHFISVLAEARSLWLWLQVGGNKPCMLAAMTVSRLAGFFYLMWTLLKTSFIAEIFLCARWWQMCVM